MIKSFSCAETEKIWNGTVSRKFPRDMQDRALRKLRQLDTALTLDDLRNPPGNHLESLNRLLKKPSSSPRWHQTTCKVV